MNRYKMVFFNIRLAALIMIFIACSKQVDVLPSEIEIDNEGGKLKLSYLALGDSYTIGESVSVKNSFPIQLEKTLENTLNVKIETKIIAKTGWRTDNLLNAIDASNDLKPPYDFVTLLIGVNNQYQDIPFEKYEEEFSELLAKAINFAGNNPKYVVVVSIPDWGYTPFGRNRDQQKISSEIDRYNDFAKLKAEESKVRFVEVTDITREGLEKPELVASDGLHPSGEAYNLFVNRIAPILSAALKD